MPIAFVDFDWRFDGNCGSDNGASPFKCNCRPGDLCAKFLCAVFYEFTRAGQLKPLYIGISFSGDVCVCI